MHAAMVSHPQGRLPLFLVEGRPVRLEIQTVQTSRDRFARLLA